MARLPPDAARRRHPLCVLGHSHALWAWPPAPRPCPGRRCTAPSRRSPGWRPSAGSRCCPTSTTPARRSRTCGARSPTCPRARSAAWRRATAGARTTPSSVRWPFGALAVAAAGAFWSSLLLMALAIGLALRALNFAIPGRVENTVVGNLVLSWGGAWLLLDHSPNPAWLPWAVALGCLTAHRRRRAHHGRDPGAAHLDRQALPAEAAADPDRQRRGEGRPGAAVPVRGGALPLPEHRGPHARSTRSWSGSSASATD